MKESLACVLNGHNWKVDHNRNVYVCTYCQRWATSISHSYIDGIAYDVTATFDCQLPPYFK